VTSFSQYNEDSLVADFFGSHVGTFLDLGAANGISGSNTRRLALNGWSGWMVEPLHCQFSELLENYRELPSVNLLNCAISSDARILKFTTDGHLSTGACWQVERRKTETPGLSCHYLASITPASLWQLTGQRPFDFVSIDCEGLDQEIILASHQLLKDTRLLCYEMGRPNGPYDPAYEASMHHAVSLLGFTRIIGTTTGNTLAARP